MHKNPTALSGKRINLVFYYFISLVSSVPSWAAEPSLPDNTTSDSIAAVGIVRKGRLLETKLESGGMVSYVVGIPFKFVVPSCAPLILQKSSFINNQDLPKDFNPTSKGIAVKPSLDFQTIAELQGSGVSCEKRSTSTQLIKMIVRGKRNQKLFGNILHIPMVPAGKSSEEKRWAKVMVLYSPSKGKIGATILEELPKGYLATYLKLAVIQGKL